MVDRFKLLLCKTTGRMALNSKVYFGVSLIGCGQVLRNARRRLRRGNQEVKSIDYDPATVTVSVTTQVCVAGIAD